MKNGSLVLALIFAITLPAISHAASLSVSMTSPSSTVTLPEGDDYATRVLQNPWDFAERRDIGWEQNFSGPSINVQNGIWTGVNATPGGYVFPLFPGFKGSAFPAFDPTDRSLPTMGIKKPIDASHYTRLCYKENHNARGTYAVYWANDPNQPQYWPDGSNQGANIDGFYTTQSATAVINSGWKIYCHDMTNLPANFQVRGGSWSGNIHALRIDPSVNGGAGATTQFQWIRLVDPSSAPNITVSWSTSGVTAADVITLYVDTTNSGFGGTPMTTFSNGVNPGSYTFPSASLPPGDYYFYVDIRPASPAGLGGVSARSGYSARVRIGTSPQVVFSSPSFTSGQEYFSSVSGNAEDMDSAADVRNLNRVSYPDSARQFSNEAFTPVDGMEDGLVFSASANTPLAGATETDAQLHMNVNSARPIDPGRFRYLVYRLAADASNFPTIEDKVRDGWVTRPVWWNNDVLADGGDPGAHVLYEGWHTYNLDVAALPMERGIPWNSYSHITNLRIDPLETHIPTNFWVDWVRLYAENRTANNQFTINFAVSGTGSTYSAALYYDTDNSGFDGTLITTMSGLSAGSHSYVWNTTGLPNGANYFVYAVVSDGTTTAKYYTPVHVKIGDYTPQPAPRLGGAPYDYDGDGKSDLPLFISSHVEPQTICTTSKSSRKKKPKKPKCTVANIITNNQSWIYNPRTAVTAKNNHVAGASLVGLDRNGDKYTDLFTVSIENGVMWWRGTESRTALAVNIPFGVANDIPVPMDRDGDGKWDIAVWRPSTGEWFILDTATLTMTVQPWGYAGDVPMPGDYDGDGRADLAVYRPSEGRWYILYSGYAAGYAPNYSASFDWGLASDVPLSFDANGDGRNDLVIYRDGTWYIYNTHTATFTVVGWGLPGDKPFAGDYDGDGVIDIAVFRASNGQWYTNRGNNQTAQYAHGNSDAVLPVNRLFP